ncbi:hypothetical protein Cni_G07792 [Canna indica]|uniref:Hydroxymethylglutaryl-coenzyme A synthase C-terminal domain-containing protein n=1 Tax=Canna indica TaxID=4628 RepID=A0AAQ3K4M8_9LILI|nr:hypothetical protein Cni_G07792 [Canna indica]
MEIRGKVGSGREMSNNKKSRAAHQNVTGRSSPTLLSLENDMIKEVQQRKHGKRIKRTDGRDFVVIRYAYGETRNASDSFKFSPEKFVETMKLMEHRYGAKDFETSQDTSLLSPGTFYLVKVDSMYRRFYAQKDAKEAKSGDNGSLANGH